jgi:non-heme chloroperoxidase
MAGLLSADDWDTQMLCFVEKSYRVIAHDRHGRGHSSQVSIGHSTGGGEAPRYVVRHGKGRVAKLVLIGAVPPIMVKTAANPDGLPIEVFDDFRKQLAANRAQFYRAQFYG